jgi:hypothetical protein
MKLGCQMAQSTATQGMAWVYRIPRDILNKSVALTALTHPVFSSGVCTKPNICFMGCIIIYQGGVSGEFRTIRWQQFAF